MIMNSASATAQDGEKSNTIGVLIVEDEPAVAEYLQELLCGAGKTEFVCSGAGDLAAALGQLAGRAFDVVLLDLGLPDSSGIKTARSVRDRFPRLPIIVLTGLADEDAGVAALRIGVQDYLKKGDINGALLIRSIYYAIERKHYLEALIESEEKYRGLFERMTEAFSRSVVVTHADGKGHDCRYLDVNRAWERLTGVPAERARGKTAGELFPEQDPRMTERYAQVAETGEPVVLEEYDRRSGRWLEVFAYSPETGHVAAFSHDVTERKQAEEALRESEERLRLAALAANFGTYDISIGTNELFWSPELRALFGAPPDAAPRVPLEEGLRFIHPDDLADVKRVLEASRDSRGDGSFRFEHRVLRSDGTVIWVLMRGRTFFQGEDGRRRPARTTGVLIDITERKRTEEALQESEERYRALVYAASSVVWRTSADGTVLLELTGPVAKEYREPEKSIGEWLNYIHPDDRQRTIETWKRAIGTRTLYENEHRNLHADGTYHYYHSRGVPVVNASGVVREWIGSSVDITARKRAEQAIQESEERFREVFAHAPVGMIVTDLRGRFQHVNQSFCRIVGYTEQELLKPGFDPRRFTHAEDIEYTVTGMKQVLAGTAPAFFQEKRYIRKDGSMVWVRISASVRRNAEGRPFQIVALVEDIHKRRQAEEALRDSEERFRTLADNIAQLAWMADDRGSIFWFNKRWFDYTGASPEQMMGGGWVRAFHPRHARRVVKSISRAYRTGESWEDTFPLRSREGSYRWFLARAIPIRNEEGKVVRWFCTNTDITERMKMEEEIRHMAQHDMLTDLPNRRLFNEIIRVELAQARRAGGKMAIFFLDLDRFKEINDTLGHEAGDDLLRQASRRLRSVIRTSDTVARIGGDEFNIVISDIAHPEYASEVAEKILKEIRRPFHIKSHELNVSTSIGISIYPDDSDDIETLQTYADIAMYYAKEHGRNKYQFYNPAIDTRSRERLRLESSLRQAIELNQFRLFFQPLIAVESGRMVSAEVLLRWQHPDGRLLEPAQFFRSAEEMGFMPEIDGWVLRNASGQIRSWIDQGFPPVCVTVNLSNTQFRDQGLSRRIGQVLEETGIPAGCLTIEIAEAVAMDDIEHTIAVLGALARIGVQVSIDNFGSGYSSLGSLKRLPIHRLKIDRTLIRDAARSAGDQAIVTAVLLMAHGMKVKVVAEGVETMNQFALLRSLHCDEAQGYFFREPLPAERFRDLVGEM